MTTSSTGSTSSTSSTSSSSTTSYLTSTQQSQSQISGLVSGLDTQSIINQLMQVAAEPQTLLKNQVTADNTKLSNLATIKSDLTAMQTASEALSQPSGWAITTATSSDSTVTASSTNATAGTVAFDVLQTASAQSVISKDLYGSLGATVASGPLSFTSSNGTVTPINVASGSLSDVVSAINGANLGVSAAAVQVDATHYRLQVTSTTTGAASSFSLTGITDGTDQLSPAQDAKLALGGNSNYTVSSSTNTFTGLENGLTVSVTKPTTGVVINVGSDTTTLTKNVQAMVDAANTVLTDIGTATAYDTSTSTGSPLTGDSTMRSIVNQILGSISLSVGGQSLANVGISLTDQGQLTFDQSAFQAAYQANPSGTQALFTSGGSITGLPSGLSGTVSLRKTTSATQDGSYAVHVTQAATKSTASYSAASLTAGTVLSFGRNGTTATYTVTGSETPQQLADAITAATQSAGINLAATDDGTTLTLNSSGYGSISNFSFSVGGTAQTVTQGQDVAGTINGVTALGSGQVLAAPDLSPPLGGLSLTVSLSAADLAAGGGDSTIQIQGGIAQTLANIASSDTDVATGSLTNDVNGVNSEIADLQSRISDWDTRLAAQQAALEQQYSNMETLLGSLKSQSSSLTSALSSLTSSSS